MVCEPDQRQPLGEEEGAQRLPLEVPSLLYPLGGSLFSFTSFLQHYRFHGFLLACYPPTFHIPFACLLFLPPSYLELAGLSQKQSRGAKPLGTTALPYSHLPQLRGHKDQLQGPKRICQSMGHLWPLPLSMRPPPESPGPALEGMSRRRKESQAQSSLPLTFSSLCPFSESVSLQPASPGTGAAQLLSFSV